MKNLTLALILIALVGLGWLGYGLLKDNPKSNQSTQSNSADKKVDVKNSSNPKSTSVTNKMLGWIGLGGGGDPNNPETWDVINGIKVPPVPDKTENDKTVDGIDINNNGVRDDVERLIAQEFGAESELYPKVMEFSASERTAMMTQTLEDARAFLKAVQCFYIGDLRLPLAEGLKQDKKHSAVVRRLDKITFLQTNTKARGKAYGDANQLVPVRRGCYIKKNGELHYEN